MDGDGIDPRRQPCSKLGQSCGGSVRRRHAVGLSVNIWTAVAPISSARVSGFAQTAPEGQMRTDQRSRPSASHPRS